MNEWFNIDLKGRFFEHKPDCTDAVFFDVFSFPEFKKKWQKGKRGCKRP